MADFELPSVITDWSLPTLSYSAFTDKIDAIDKKVTELNGMVDQTPAGLVNETWRVEWRKYRRRWEIWRDSRATWISRVLALEGAQRLARFEAGYIYWAADFEKRSKQLVPPTEPVRKPGGSLAKIIEDATPPQVWWILGGAAALYVLTRK